MQWWQESEAMKPYVESFNGRRETKKLEETSAWFWELKNTFLNLPETSMKFGKK